MHDKFVIYPAAFVRSLKRLAVVLLCLVVSGYVYSLVTPRTLSVITTGVLFSPAYAAETGPRADEAYSDWDWDKVPIEADKQEAADKTNSNSETQTKVPTTPKEAETSP